jgi:hypothetical protein
MKAQDILRESTIACSALEISRACLVLAVIQSQIQSDEARQERDDFLVTVEKLLDQTAVSELPLASSIDHFQIEKVAELSSGGL